MNDASSERGVPPADAVPTVLLVDDEPVIRELVRSVLSRDGRFALISANDGAEAVELANERRPRLILLDVRMPYMNGIEACRAIREDLSSADTKIVMLSAMGQDDDIERGYQAGADDYFLKPFKPSELLERVQDALGLPAA